MHHVSGSVMVADLLTKPVARAIFHKLLALLDAFAATGEVCPPL